MLNRHKIHERKKKKNCTNINLRVSFFFYRIFEHIRMHIDAKFFEETIFNDVKMFIKLKLYPVNIFQTNIYFFIEQVQHVHMFRIVISHSLSSIAYSNSAVQLYIIRSIVWYVKMEQLMVKDVVIEMVYDRYTRYSRKRRCVQRDVIEMILFYSRNYSNKNIIISKRLCKYLIAP